MITDPNSSAAWLARLAKTKKRRKELATGEWAESVMFRKGQPFAATTDPDTQDDDRVNVNLDWSKTKAKHANLFSQVPEIHLLPKHPQFAPAVPIFAKALNDTLTKSKVGAAMDEAVLDTINASGIGVVMVGFERLTELKEVPVQDVSGMDPAMVQQGITDGIIPTQKVPVPTSTRYPITRLSPGDFLWPVEFTGSDFDQSPWVGRSGTMTGVEATKLLGLTKEQLDKAMGGGKPITETIQQDSTRVEDEGMVNFDEIYFWNYKYDPEEKYFESIHRMVFVNGLDKAIINEPWKGQKFDPNTKSYTGACEYPIRVLTLTYITDDAIPPSDSAIGRPQVLELIKSRSQMILQRDRSMPLRWHNVNFIDPTIETAIMRGTFQGSIPVNGDGSRAVGEVARASFPREDMEFDRVAKNDLDEAWQTSANQVGSANSGQRSASEVNIVQANFKTRIGYERARVGQFFVGIAKVVAGYLALYGDFQVVGADQLKLMDQSWNRAQISQQFVYDIFQDSTVLLDADQKIDRLLKVFNMFGQSGIIDLIPLASDILLLAGQDPARLIKKPQPKPPEPATITMRLAGAQDLTNPMTLAFLNHSGQAPTPDDMQAAFKMLEEYNKQQMQVQQQMLNPEMPSPQPEGMPPGGGGPTPDGAQPAPGEGAPTPPTSQLNAPEFGVQPKVNKRGDFGG